MRHLLLPASLLCLGLACGSSKLGRGETERDIAQDYPVVVTVKIPKQASAIKGSPEHARLVGLQEKLTATGTFTVSRQAEGDREAFRLAAGASLPTGVQTLQDGWELPAAKAEFAKTTRIETRGSRARVTYQIRLASPSPYFPVFQLRHPKAAIGATQDRHAEYMKEGRKWILDKTDEKYSKAR